ncbi:MAG: DUF1922 domain-containing protein [Candidatus Thermoplasmatota archaeon]|nr:DUF1922 domain-containing protein [Candidatus Thermoplasmatota archaeon]
MLDVKYGVIVCPKCGMSKGVEANRKTTTCQCGREIKMSSVKLMFQTDSPMELADSVAIVNASLQGGEHLVVEKKGKKKDPYFVISERAKPIKDPLERMRVVARELTTLKVEFNFEDMKKVAAIVGKDSPEDMIARLKEHNLIYETGDGKYRSV